MQTFFMMGKYTAESMRDVSSNRTEKAVKLINELEGKVISMYALLGEYDLALIVQFGDTQKAMKASLGISMLSNISFTTLPAITVDDFDRIMGQG